MAKTGIFLSAKSTIGFAFRSSLKSNATGDPGKYLIVGKPIFGDQNRFARFRVGGCQSRVSIIQYEVVVFLDKDSLTLNTVVSTTGLLILFCVTIHRSFEN